MAKKTTQKKQAKELFPELNREMIQDAIIVWFEEHKPDTPEIDKLIDFIEQNEPEYPELQSVQVPRIPVLHGQGTLRIPDIATDGTGTRTIQHTSKTLAAKHFQMAMKKRPVVWDDHIFWDLTQDVGEGTAEKEPVLKAIAMLLNLLETIDAD